MKANKANLKEAIKNHAKTAIAKRAETKLVKDVRKSAGSSVIEVVSEYTSISKYFRGVCLGDWSDADHELRIFKALGQDGSTRGGVFVPPILSNEVIELLKEKSVLRTMPGVRQVVVADKMQYNTVTDAPTISWGSENTAITEDTTLAFGRETLETKKAVCLYKMSRELLANANVSIDGLIRQELADKLGLEEDKVFLEGTGGVKPLGIYYNPRIVSTDLSAAIAVDNLKDMLYNIRILQSEVTGWVMHPRTVNDLCQKKDAEGRYIFGAGPGEANLSTLWGLPLRQTTQLPITMRPASAESYVVAGRWSDLLIGEGEGMRIDTSTEADTAFAADQVWLRLVRYVGCLLRHPESFGVIKGIQAG